MNTINKISLRVLEKNKDVKWNDLVQMLPNANIFHTEEWLNFIDKTFRVKHFKTLILNEGEIIGIFPIFLKRHFFLKVGGSPLIAENNPYMGFALKDKRMIREVITSLENYFSKLGLSFIRMSFDHFNYQDIFLKFNYTIKEKKSFRLNLTNGKEEIWKAMGPKCRNQIRKGEKEGCFIKEFADDGFISSYYEMCSEVYSRQALPPLLNRKYYESIIKEFKNSGMIKVFMAYNSNKLPIAGAIVLLFKRTAYYLDGASFRKYSKLAPNNFIQWHIIKGLIDKKYNTYDLLGGDIESIARFKRGFGAINHPVLYTEKNLSIFSDSLRNFYSRVKTIGKKIRFLTKSC